MSSRVLQRFEGMQKRASSIQLSDTLDGLWSIYGRPEEIEKSAAASYFFDLQKPNFDRDALGTEFCKLAGAINQDPWVLADEVECNLASFQELAKTAADPQVRELAQFYVDWADSTIEKAAFLGAISKGVRMLGAGAKQGAKNLRGGLSSSSRMSQAVKSGPARPRSAWSAAKREGANVNKIRAHGGGSYRRGRQMMQKNVAAKSQRRAAFQRGPAPATPHGPTKGPTTQGPPPAAPAKKPMFTTGQKLIGAGAVGAPLVAVGASQMGGGAPQY